MTGRVAELRLEDGICAAIERRGTASITDIGTELGAYADAVWDRRQYVRIRDALRNLRSRSQIEKVGARRDAQYRLVTNENREDLG
jgi:hypothetical protein